MLYHKVRRTRTESSMRFSRTAARRRVAGLAARGGRGFRRGTENIAAAAASLKERLPVSVTEFAAKAVHVDFDEIGEGVEGLVPDVLGNFRAADDAVGIAGQEFEERIFLGGEGNEAIAALGRLRRGIELQIAHDNPGRPQILRATQE